MLLHFCFMLLLGFFLGESVTADYTPIYELNATYKLHRHMNWDGAVRTCAAYRGHLWAPRSALEATLVTRALHLPSISPWVGYTNKKHEHQWISTTGEELPSGPLRYSLKPATRLGPSCVAINNIGHLDVWDCSEVGSFICEANNDILKNFSSLFVNYKYIDDFRGYYKLSLKNLNWREAQNACKAEGGSLWAPYLLEEAKMVITALNIDGIVPWIGLNDLKEEGVWTSVEDPEPTLYNHWAQQEPDGGILKNCAAINSEGLIFAWDCNSKGSYVCKVGHGNPNDLAKNNQEINTNLLEFPTVNIETGVNNQVTTTNQNENNLKKLIKELVEQVDEMSNELLKIDNRIVLLTDLMMKEKDQKNPNNLQTIKGEFQLTVNKIIHSNEEYDKHLKNLHRVIETFPEPFDNLDNDIW